MRLPVQASNGRRANSFSVHGDPSGTISPSAVISRDIGGFGVGTGGIFDGGFGFGGFWCRASCNLAFAACASGCAVLTGPGAIVCGAFCLTLRGECLRGC